MNNPAGGALARVAALAGKELAELGAAPAVLAGPAAMLVTAVAVPFAVAIGVPHWTGERLETTDLVTVARDALGPAAPLGAEAAAQAFLLVQFLPLLVLVPVIGAMALVTTSIVDELQRRSLEPLLATPITTLELLAAKAGSAWVVSLAMLTAGAALFAAGAGWLAEPGVTAALATPRTAALLVGLAPGAAAAALMLGVVVSSRVKDARTAQQFAVVIVLPLVALFLGRIGDAGGVGMSALLSWTAAAWLLTGVLAVAGVRLFDRERILTRWTE